MASGHCAPSPLGRVTGSELHYDKEESDKLFFFFFLHLLVVHWRGRAPLSRCPKYHHDKAASFSSLTPTKEKQGLRPYSENTALNLPPAPPSQSLCFLLHTCSPSPPTSRVPQFASCVSVLTYAGCVFRGPVLLGFICQVRRGSLVYVQSALLTGCSTLAAPT